MGVIGRLATSLGRKDEVPNTELAKQIAARGDGKAVKELVDGLKSSNKAIQSDCIKVLYEIGERKPALIADYDSDFLALLDSGDNRMVWGAMTALDSITLLSPKSVHSALGKIIRGADGGSVITRDHAVSILIKLYSLKLYSEEAFPLLLKQLKLSPTNQLPMYAEKAAGIINDGNKSVFIRTLTTRLSEIEKDSKRRRVEAVIKKLS
ncbi:MAG: hypothetical protein OK422_01525 [Thaumarchaeota archaeon]|nr:hypothetical protein [Nitrososphaerota archaeon]